MTWETMAALITVALAGISIGKVVYELSKTLTKLNCSVEILNASLSALTSENSDEHLELFCFPLPVVIVHCNRCAPLSLFPFVSRRAKFPQTEFFYVNKVSGFNLFVNVHT